MVQTGRRPNTRSMQTKLVEYYGGPVDGDIRTIPADTTWSKVRIGVSIKFSPSGQPRMEEHYYEQPLDGGVLTEPARFYYKGFKIL